MEGLSIPDLHRLLLTHPCWSCSLGVLNLILEDLNLIKHSIQSQNFDSPAYFSPEDFNCTVSSGELVQFNKTCLRCCQQKTAPRLRPIRIFDYYGSSNDGK
ncbi:hypothetical protein MVEN_00299400 [Mycena venus]|uniref:Uncharacterized protein n=1 Tax=Mycena venus TaxID=2733690 RepID=A0A8H6Z030_9AGAR|nr:hypothetical protein MVEN_00299400 [Mycena venus]